MTSSVDPKDTNPAERTSQIYGDSIAVGNIEHSGAVAIGRDAQATINQYTEIIVKADNFEDLPPAPGEPPYKGLAYFTEADKDIYFGRGKLSDQLVKRLQKGRFLALIGASGSGKSSLLRAGIIPRLRAHNWVIHVINPGVHPLSSLAASLTQDELDPASADDITAAMVKSPETLAKVGEKLAARKDADRLLLAIDQFEELFTQCKDPAEQQAFADNLVHAVEAEGATTVLVSMRADFYDRVSEFAVLTDLVSQQQDYIKPMAQEDLVRVIAEPARLGGWQFVEGLVEQIVEDVGREPGRLPLLSHALLETWERRRGVVMTLGGYRDAGGVEGAIAQTAEETLNRLIEEDQSFERVTQEIFLGLTELGEGAEDTRRIASREELAAGIDDNILDAVLEELVAARLITMDKGEVEVAHEALIRRWPTLKEWLEDNRERLRFQRRLSRDAQLWQELDEDEDVLYGGARLARAVELVEIGAVNLTGLPLAFLDASRERVEREEQEHEAQRQHELRQAQELAAAAQAREQAEIEARNAAEAQREVEEQARQQAEADATNLRRRAFYLMGALGLAAILALFALIFFQNAQNSAQEAQDNLAQAQTKEAEAIANGALAVSKGEEAVAAQSTAEAETIRAQGAEATAEAERAVAERQGERALAQSLQANSRALIANQPNNQELTQARLLAVEAAGVNSQVGSDAEKTGSATLLFSLAYEQPTPYQPVTTLNEQTGGVSSVAWNGDGRRLASGSGDSTVTIWDTASWEPVTTLSKYSGSANTVTWNGDGSRLATGSADDTVIIWDTATWEPVTTLSDHTDGILSVAWNGDGSRLATGSADDTVIIWNTTSWEPVTTLSEHMDTVNSVAWNEDGSRLASGSRDGTVIIWNTMSWEPVTILSEHTSNVLSMAWNEDGSRLASSRLDGTVIIWNTTSWEPVTTLSEHTNSVESVAWNEDGSHLASGSWDGTVIIWNTTSWQPVMTLSDHTDGILSVAWNGDGSRLASASADIILRDVGEVIIWDTTNWEPVTTRNRHMSVVSSVAWNRDDSRLASGSWDGTVIIWNTVTWEPVTTLSEYLGGVSSVAWNMDGSRLASASCVESNQEGICIMGEVIIWDTVTWEPVTTLREHTFNVWSVAWNEDGSRLASASCGESNQEGNCIMGEVIIWDTVTWEPVTTLPEHTEVVKSLTWNEDGSRLASGSDDGTVIIWDTSSWQPVMTLSDHTDGVLSVAWNGDGSRLASASADGTVIIWNTVTWEPVTTLPEHTFYVWSVAWNEDGSRLASGHGLGDGTVIIWDTASWEPVTTLSEYSDGVSSVTWNGDGSRLATGSRDSTVIIWEFPNFTQLQCQLAGRNLSLVEWEVFLPEVEYHCICEWPAGEGAPTDAPGCAGQ